MVLTNRKGEFAGHITVHPSCLIFNNKEKNVLYDFEEYEKLLRDLDVDYNIDTKRVLEYICWNCIKVDQIVLSKKKAKKKPKINPDQYTLF